MPNVPLDDARPPRHDIPLGGRSGFVEIDGRQLHYLEWGHAGRPAVVCLHGGGRIAAAGHLAAGDNPESFVGLVKGFLREIGA